MTRRSKPVIGIMRRLLSPSTKTVYAMAQITSNMETSELIKGISTQCAVNG